MIATGRWVVVGVALGVVMVPWLAEGGRSKPVPSRDELAVRSSEVAARRFEHEATRWMFSGGR